MSVSDHGVLGQVALVAKIVDKGVHPPAVRSDGFFETSWLDELFRGHRRPAVAAEIGVRPMSLSANEVSILIGFIGHSRANHNRLGRNADNIDSPGELVFKGW